MKTVRDWLATFLRRVHTHYQRVWTFVRRDLWLVDLATASFARRSLLGLLQVVLLVLHGFFLEHQCLLRASALTYTTLLALVPMLAFMFAFLKGLGVQNLLEPLLIDKLSVGSEETVRLIINYVNKVEVGTLGAIGLGALLFSTLVQLGAVEEALNTIWGVPRSRAWLRKLTDYISMMVIAPLMVLLATTVNAALKNQALVAALLETRGIGDVLVLGFTLLPYVAMWVAFTFFYTFMPNTQVKLGPALVGGLIAGTLWQLAQWAYIGFQVGVARYQTIYGAFAQLPLLLVWLYVSWVIALLGAEVTFACQNVAVYPSQRFAPMPSYAVKEWVASALYFSLAQAFTAGTGPWSAVAFAQHHRISSRLLHDILQPLLDTRLIVEDAAAPQHYVPGRDPATITPWHILHALRHQGERVVADLSQLCDARVAMLMAQVEAAERQVAGERSITQWLAEKDPV
jgi:membrane protein